MGLNLDAEYGQTPMEEDEKEGLLIPIISTREELDEYEQQNIEDAIQWLQGRVLKPRTIFTEKFICALHHRMYSNVWKWAGTFRKTNKNLGIHPSKISVSIRTLLDDAVYWVEHQTYPPDEAAIRFKHRLVSIHCFPNGNGRHSRLIADIIVEKIYNQPVFSWGERTLSQARAAYINAVQSADHGNYEPLLSFARS